MNAFGFKNRKKKNYFEGYYIRIIDQNKDFNKAFIFGVTKYKEDPHAFMQVVDGNEQSTKYYRYKIEDFTFTKKDVTLPGIYLSLDEISIKTDDFSIQGKLSRHIVLDRKFGTNSAMSFMYKLPMKTYQEVVYHHATFKGNYTSNQNIILDGISYMEKTYGTHFPSKWIWIQSNQFVEDIYLSCSIGKASFLGIPFLGYVVSLIYQGKEIRFATYTKSQIKIDVHNSKEVVVTCKSSKYRLVIKAKQVNPITLIGPIDKGQMILDVFESITSTLQLELYEKDALLHTSKAINVGMECMNYE